ncbi:MAG: DNA polymerase III subunit delta [Spirochaetota bacterium]
MKIDSAYILSGPDAGRRIQFIDDLRRDLAKASGSKPEEYRLYAADCSVGDLLSIAMNGALFSDARIIEYRDAEAVKNKADVTALLAYLAHPSPDVVLLLVTDSFGLEKAIEDAVGKDRKKTFYELFENEKPRWVSKRLAEASLHIDEDGIEAFLELVENDTQAMEAACARLSLVFAPGSRLTGEDIENAIARNRSEDAFSLFARMVSDEPVWAMECLDTVLADRQGGAVPLIAALVWCWKRLLRLHVLQDEGESFDGACLKSGIRAKSLLAVHRSAISRFRREDCERVLALLVEFDARARGAGSQLERTLLQTMVYAISVKKGRICLDSSYL